MDPLNATTLETLPLSGSAAGGWAEARCSIGGFWGWACLLLGAMCLVGGPFYWRQSRHVHRLHREKGGRVWGSVVERWVGNRGDSNTWWVRVAYCLPSPGASTDYLKVTKPLKLPDKRTWQSRDYALGKGVRLSHVLLEPPHEPLDVLPLSELEDPQVERLRALDCVALVVLGATALALPLLTMCGAGSDEAAAGGAGAVDASPEAAVLTRGGLILAVYSPLLSVSVLFCSWYSTRDGPNHVPAVLPWERRRGDVEKVGAEEATRLILANSRGSQLGLSQLAPDDPAGEGGGLADAGPTPGDPQPQVHAVPAVAEGVPLVDAVPAAEGLDEFVEAVEAAPVPEVVPVAAPPRLLLSI